jgi:hypothetical protein
MKHGNDLRPISKAHMEKLRGTTDSIGKLRCLQGGRNARVITFASIDKLIIVVAISDKEMLVCRKDAYQPRVMAPETAT